MTPTKVLEEALPLLLPCAVGLVAALCFAPEPASAQVQPPPDNARNLNPGALPTDLTPLIFSGERGLLSHELKYKLLRNLPSRLWFNTSTEVSQRLETNPIFSIHAHTGDYVFRTLPNVTVGYNVLNNTGVYVNYFVIKDVYAREGTLGVPTTQSLALGVQQKLYSGRKTSAQFDFQARELWQSKGIRQFDFLPSISITRSLRPNVVAFGSTVLQLRGRNYFVAPTREIDPFYSAGILIRHGMWNFIFSDTFVTNFRHPPFPNPVPRHGNVSMIAGFEVNRPVSNRYLPGLIAFVRTEPVWDWRGNNITGLSGFDFRLFGGVRFAASKRAYNQDEEAIRRMIRQHNERMKQLKQSGDGSQTQPSSQSLEPSANSIASETSPAATTIGLADQITPAPQ